MGYPFILAYDGDVFARVNYNGEWSVRWDKALFVRYEKVTKRNKAILACTEVLVAAKDNFFVTPWDESDSWADRWSNKQIVIDILDHDADEEENEIQLNESNEKFAIVKPSGKWAIDWTKVTEISTKELDRRSVTLIGFCKLLLAAKDNFPTTSWWDDDTDDEEE